MKKIMALLLATGLLTACSLTPISPTKPTPGSQTSSGEGPTEATNSHTGSETSPDPETNPSTTTWSVSTQPIAEAAKTSTEGAFDWRNASVYYAMTDRFQNGDSSNDESYGRLKVDAKGTNHATFQGGDFNGLTQKIREGYFSDLGVNAIWMTAPYEQIHGFVSGGDGEFAHYAFHGYYALDWTMVDRNFGTREEFRELVDAAHDKGIRIILDVVLNHTGYHTVQDMVEYDFGAFGKADIEASWQPTADERYDSYHEWIDYGNEHRWQKWWGSDWVRAGLPGYTRGGSDDYTMTLAGLPDIITETEETVDLPPVLVTKWNQEKGEAYDAWRLRAADKLRQNMDLAPAGYITAWLAAWVREFGIDGFRIDTAKHVEKSIWEGLKAKSSQALAEWREENPDSPGADFKDDFFMVGEVWGQGLEKNDYYDHGFDALINYTFQGESFEGPAYRSETMPAIFQRYADTLNEQGNNVLSYLSSHDTKLFPRKKLEDGLTYLLLLPGALEIFYGDESGRAYVRTGKDVTMGTRGFMNWGSIDQDVFDHFKKLGSFRARNLAVGAGSHQEISKVPYVFQRNYEKGNLSNTVLVAMDQTPGAVLDVSTAFNEGDLVRDAYTMTGYLVTDGKVQVAPDESGLVLLEKMIP